MTACARSLVVIGQNHDSGNSIETCAANTCAVASSTTRGNPAVAELGVSGKCGGGAVDLGQSGWHGLMAQLASLG